MIRRLAVVAVVVAAMGVASCGDSPPKPPSDGAAADLGFRTPAHGFTFPNYGETLPDGTLPTNLTAQDVHTMFGDAVCADGPDPCDLIPEAVAWQDEMNQLMAGGHCFGFAVAAELAYLGKLDPKTFGGTGVPQLAISENAALQRTIAYGWTLQILDSVWEARTTGTPNEILNKLIDVLKPDAPEAYTITFFKKDFTGGHAVTPIAVTSQGDGRFAVQIYDNNWPGQTRTIQFDTTTDTWTYDAAVNPSAPEELYQGDAESKTIELLPTSPGLGPQPCPFCEKRQTSAARAGSANAAGTPTGSAPSKATQLAQIALLGGTTNHADLLISDAAGHRLGFVKGKMVQEIPGAHFDPIFANGDWTATATPVFFVPVNSKYTITIDGKRMTHDDVEKLAVIGPSYDVSIDDIDVQPGERDTLMLDPFGASLSYTSSRAESPTIEIAASEQKGDYAFKIAGVSDRPGSTITVAMPPNGGLLIMNNAGTDATSSVDLQMIRYTSQGLQTFRHDAISLAGDDTAQLEFGAWVSPDQGIPLATTHRGKTVTRTLSNHGSG